MARFRRKARSRSFGRRFKSYARRAGVGKSASLVQLDAMIYGAVRAPISDKVSSLVPIPVIGTVGDEVVMGLLNWLVAKNTSGMIRDVAIKGLVVENARLGEQIVGMTGLSGAAQNNSALYG